MRTFLCALIPASLLIAIVPRAAAETEYWTAPFGPGGTWNLYAVDSRRMTWTEAKTAAEVKEPLSGGEKTGHLVTISSAAENSFVCSLPGEGDFGARFHIGLTDSEEFGGKEAGSAPRKGWAWITGEPVTWTGWAINQPDEWVDEGDGEDGVCTSSGGAWYDVGIGGVEQASQRFGCFIEWDLHSPEPVKGARKLERTLPAQWKVDFASPPAEAAAPRGRWNIWHVPGADPSVTVTLRSMVAWMEPELSGAAGTSADSLQFAAAGSAPPRTGGWRGETEAFPWLQKENWGALCATWIQLDREQTWTFMIWVDDLAAVRIPGFKWKAANGLGFIDPLDPETLVRDLVSKDTWMTGTVTLPAGSHRLEVVMANMGGAAEFSLLAAPGEHPLPGSTDTWRPVGWQPRGKILWPTISPAGWEVRCTVPQGRQKGDYKLVDATTDLEKTAKPTPSARINFSDPQSPGDALFPVPAPFPDDPPDDQERFGLMATATLVIPEDGEWHIGLSCDAKGGLQVEGAKWISVLNFSGESAKMADDTFYWDAGEQFTAAGLVRLKKGEYPIRLIYADSLGPANVSVFAAPAGYPPRLLSSDAPASTEDVPGLSFAAKPDATKPDATKPDATKLDAGKPEPEKD